MGYNAKIWNQRNGLEGEPYKQSVLDPILIQLASPIKGKIILDAGCGNGYLGIKLFKLGASEIILIDNHKENLEFAKTNSKRANASFKSFFSDLTNKLPIKNLYVDMVVSNMVLTEIESLEKTFSNFYRILKNNGKLIFSVIHPVYDYHQYLRGNKNKVNGIGGYFDRLKGRFILGIDSHPDNIIKVSHIHRTLEDYIKALLKCGFHIESLIEPQINGKLLKVAPRFKENLQYPLSLVISAKK